MTQGTGAQGFLGIALEATAGTYTPPTKFVPVESESLNWVQETVWRRPIRQSADIVGAVDGNSRVEGDIGMEAFEDVVAMMLLCARTTVTQAGTAPNFTYTFTGSANAVPDKTLSVTTVRNGVVFGWSGLIVTSFGLSVEDGILKFNPSMIGREEATDILPVPTWDSGIQSQPYGAGHFKLEVPTATQIFDADGFDFNVDDSGEAQYRLRDDSKGASFVSYGERSVTLSLTRDFESRADFDSFKALTSQSVTLTATKGTNNEISVVIPAAIKDTYEVALSGQGDLTRATINYNGVLDATGKAYTISVKTQEDLTTSIA